MGSETGRPDAGSFGTLPFGTPSFGTLLRDLRMRVPLTQEALSQRSGVSVRALADLERGRARGPQRRTVKALAQALELDETDELTLEQAASAGRPRVRADRSPAGCVLPLPRPIDDFTARRSALRDLRALVDRPVGPPPVVVVSGRPGLGKTAFAVHAAHELAPRFPDGRFHLDLRGLDQQPVRPHDALGKLLRALGVAETAVPRETDDRSDLFQSLVREREVLLVLDNAADDDQVHPLLPSAGHALTLVTSRRPLAGLVAAVHRVELAALRREESVELLTRIVGPARTEPEQQAARDLADLCGNLPLAVRIAGQRLAARPRERLGKLVTELTREEDRLDLLQAGSLQVRAVFALSYERLAPDTRTVLRRASLAAGADFSARTAALLADLPPRQTRRALEEAVDAGLLEPHPHLQRYRFHDLLKLFAAERAEAEDDVATRTDVVDRAAWWTLRRAAAAALHFDADRDGSARDADPEPSSAPADRDQARGWLEAEREQWLAALHRAGAEGRHRYVLDTAEAMHWFSDVTAHWGVWVEVFHRAVDSARALASGQDEAVHLNYLSWAHLMCAYDYQRALDTAENAQARAEAVGDRLQVGWALCYGAQALRQLGRNEESIVRLRESVSCLETVASPQGQLARMSSQNMLGAQLRDCGRAAEALTLHRRSDEICRDGIADQSEAVVGLYRALAWQHLGNDYACLGRWPDAETYLRRALAVFEVADMPKWSALVRLDLGLVLCHLAHPEDACRELREARDALAELSHPRASEADHAWRQLSARQADPDPSTSARPT